MCCPTLPLKSALIPFLAGILERIGFTGESSHINRRHALDKIALPLMAERFAQLAEPIGAPLPRPLPFPHLSSSTEQMHKSDDGKFWGIKRPEKIVAFCPGAEYGPAKRWPARHFAALTDELS